jgi:hypothetical protein
MGTRNPLWQRGMPLRLEPRQESRNLRPAMRSCARLAALKVHQDAGLHESVVSAWRSVKPIDTGAQSAVAIPLRSGGTRTGRVHVFR